MSRFLGVLGACGMATGVASAGIITTAAPNNGSGGVFLQLTPATDPLEVTSFDVPFAGAVGGAALVEVWVRSGPYAGFTASNVGWTLHETVSATAAGTLVFAPVVLTTPLPIPMGTTSIYLHGITTGQGLRYTGTTAAPPVTTWSNADVTLFSNISRTGAVPFAGTQFTPRTFSGNVNYNVIPAPGSLALLAAGGLLAARRRR
ncbi:MAG: hypothetical protein JNM80_01855 [Phycisphaerae bacterium]|nr:hypothetical protein [Phycisphaerae bacterium]